MTTDEALKKELWAAIYESRDLNGHDQAPTSAVVAAVLPIIRKAQAAAWAEGYNDGVTDTLNNAPVETPSPYAEYDLTEEAP